MKMLNKIFRRIGITIENWVEECKLLWYSILNSFGAFDDSDQIGKIKFNREWEYRINRVIGSNWNETISRSQNAGVIKDGYQMMHNNLKVLTGAYYGLPIAKMLYLNRGVHEPEEEKIFGDILELLHPGSVMLEMGAHWSFYSMWFLISNKGGKAYMIEPDPKFLEVGKKNFQMNGLNGTFDKFFMGSKVGVSEADNVMSLDGYMALRNIERLEIAHADIQGFEMEMLIGAANALDNKLIDYFFISTHTNELHNMCVLHLKSKGYKILYSFDLDKISSFDGLIVATCITSRS